MCEKPIIPPAVATEQTDSYRIYDAIWRNMDRENNLINQRLGWAIFFSAGIFSASAVVVNIMMKLVDTRLAYLTTWMIAGCFLLGCLAALGVYFSLRVLRGVDAALEQIEYLRERYQRDEAKFKAISLPRPFGEKKDIDRGRSASTIFPQTLVLIWSAAWGFSVLAAGIFGTLAVLGIPIVEPPSSSVSPLRVLVAPFISL